jgi:putative SOS response-associated peptidase YedK
MPVLIEPRDHDTWLDPDIDDPERLLALLEPHPGKHLLLTPVSPYVNNPRNDDPRCIEPLSGPGGG